MRPGDVLRVGLERYIIEEVDGQCLVLRNEATDERRLATYRIEHVCCEDQHVLYFNDT